MEQTALDAAVSQVVTQPSQFIVFCWYMVGVFLRATWRCFEWYGFDDAHRAPLRQLVARTVKGVILGSVLAFLWMQGLVGQVAEWVGYDGASNVLTQIGLTVPATVAAGFFIEWLLGGWILAWFGSHVKDPDAAPLPDPDPKIEPPKREVGP